MEEQVEIVFRNMERQDYLVQLIEEKIAKLEQFYSRIISALVVVELPHKNHQTGNEYRATIELNVPGKRLVTSRNPGSRRRHENPASTINDAFAAIARQLEEYGRQQRGDVKTHWAPLQGRINRIFPIEGYGFVLLTDGREIYFHQNAVVNPEFEDLEIGAPVRVVIANDESPIGPQATTVEAITEMQYVEVPA